MNENQLELDFAPIPVFRAGCRVAGEIQIHETPAVEYRQAMSLVKAGVDGARPILVLVK